MFLKFVRINAFKSRIYYLMAALGLLSFMVKAQSANKNVLLRSHINLGVEDNANIWGYVDSLGNEYALAGNYRGLTIINITNPDNPFVVKHVKGPLSTWREVKTWKDYAYVTNESGGGLQIINLKSLPDTNGILVKQWQPFVLGDTLRTIHALHIEKGFAYLYGSNIGTRGSLIADLSDPWNPTVAGLVQYSYIHDGYVRNDTLYAAHIYDGHLRVWDCTNKSNPQLIGATPTPWLFTHNSWLSDNGKTVYITDEVNGSACVAFDVSDLQNIREISRIKSQNPNGGAPIHNTHVKNDFIYNSWYADGITIVDGSKPDNLVNVAWFDTSPISGGGFYGCWGVYPFFPSGNIVASDRQTGIWVLTPQLKRAAYVEFTFIDSLCGGPVNNVKVLLQGPDTVVGYSNPFGILKTGTPEQGLYTITISCAGYNTIVFENVNLLPGQVFSRNLKLQRQAPINVKIMVCDEFKNPISDADLRIFNQDYSWDFKTSLSALSLCGLNAGGYNFQVNKWGYLGLCIYENLDANTDTFYLTLRKGYYDDFTFDNHWEVSGTATAGNWIRGKPIIENDLCSGVTKPVADVVNDCGFEAYVTGAEQDCSGNNNVDNGYTRLLSPIMDLSNYQYPILTFYRWFFANGSISSTNDTLKIIADNGAIRAELLRVSRASDSLSIWKKELIKLKDFIPITSTMRIEFIIEDRSPVNLIEAGIDLFMVDDTTRGVGMFESTCINNRFFIFPNPSNGQFSLFSKLYDDYYCEVLSPEGKFLKEFSVHKPELPIVIDLKEFSSGIYLLKIKTSQSIEIHRLVKL